MRVLAIFSFSFAAAVLLYVRLLPAPVCMVLFIAALLLGVAFFLRRNMWTKRVQLAAFGLAFGFLWCWLYAQWNLVPLQGLNGQTAQITLQVIEEAEETERGYRILCKSGGTRVLAYLDDKASALQPGDMLCMRAQLTETSQMDNLYYISRDIPLLAFQEGELRVEAGAASWREYPRKLYRSLQRQIAEIFPADVEPFARALMTGDTSHLDYSLRNDLSVVGISHVVAVSGMHVSLICSMVLTLCLRRRRLAAGFCLGAMWFFAAMLGFTPSVTRAVVMNSLQLLAPVLDRENDGPTSLSFALLILLLCNPWAIASASLQLSFGAVAGITLFTPWICQGLKRLTGLEALQEKWGLLSSLLHKVISSCSVTLGASVLTVPLVAMYFGTVSIISFLSNLLLLPLLTVVFSLSYPLVLLSLFTVPGARLVAFVPSWTLRGVTAAVRWFADFPYAALYTRSFYVVLWLIFSYAMLGVYLCIRKRGRWMLVGIAAMLLAVPLLQRLPAQELRFTMLDVGQGQCILIESGDATLVVDCGGSEGEQAGEDAARTLLSRGRTCVDALILSHYDTDHVGGVLQLMGRMEIGQLYLPDISPESEWRAAILQAAKEENIPVTMVRQDVTLRFAEGNLSIFAPLVTETANDSIAVLLSAAECDILITGDMSQAAERELLLCHTIPDLEVLVAGHHGSEDSTSPQLLQYTRPELLLISVGENSYGHPTPQVLARAEKVGARVYRTDEIGTIILTR